MNDGAVGAKSQTRIELLETALARCISWAEDKQVALYAQGSLAKGGFDEFSDLDLTFVHDESMESQLVLGEVETELTDKVEKVASFFAEHVGAPSTRIIYFRVSDWVCKADLTAVSSAEWHPPSEVRLLVDCPSVTQSLDSAASAPAPDSDLLLEKLCGWLWFTHSRIARGELFSAARSIDFSREHALLPIMQNRLGLPFEGHRRLEVRMSAMDVGGLRRTYPKELEKDELHRALGALQEMVMTEARHLRQESNVGVRIMRVWQLISDDHEQHRGYPVGSR